MRGLRIAKEINLPVDAATQTMLIVGKRGTGKSSTATRFTEQLIKHKVPVAVLDPVDVWWGLKAGADGQREEGLEVYVFGGKHADHPLEPTAGALMADVLVDNRVNIVMVVREFSNRDKAHFVKDFAERLFQRNQDVMHLFCEEAHEFMPQQPYGGEEEMLGRMLKLQKLGRTSGIGLSSITQRPASLNKNATTQAEILVAHRLLGPQDIAAIEGWIKHHHVEDLKQEVLSTLPELKTGEAWVWAPDFPEDDPIGLKRVHILMPETFDSRKTPKPGEARVEPRQLAPVDLEKLGQKMAATRERAKQTDPRYLQQEVVRLRAEVARKSPISIPNPIREEVKVPVLKDAQLKRLEEATTRFEGAREKATEILEKASASVTEAAAQVRAALSDAKSIVANGAKPRSLVTAPVVAPATRLPVVDRRPASSTARRSAEGDDARLSLAERKILTALAQYPQGRSVVQTAVLTSYAVNGGGFRNALGALRSKGFIEGSEILGATDAGLKALGQWEQLPQPGPGLLDHWMRQLSHAEREIVRVLGEVYPKSLTPEDLASRTASSSGEPYAPDGGGFRNALGRLRTLELIDGRGELKLNDDLVGVLA